MSGEPLKSITLHSYAKINLYLKILRRRPDGYHDIQSLFERISLADRITLTRLKEGITLETDSDEVPSDASNLAWRAAELLRQECGVRQGVGIRIRKRIPVSAGLGGGSSNAATTLLGLNRLWNLWLPQKKLLELGARLGSDVPFFILEKSFALVSGRGEVLKPVAVKNLHIWHCLVKPDFGISTKSAYQSLDLSALTPPCPDAKMLVQSIRDRDASTLQGLLTNGLELSLNNRVKTILNIKCELLRQGAMASLMSGSGSAVFGIFASPQAAAKAAGLLRIKYKRYQVFTAHTY